MIHSLAHRIFELEWCVMQRREAFFPIIKTGSFLSVAVKMIKNMMKEAVISVERE